MCISVNVISKTYDWDFCLLFFKSQSLSMFAAKNYNLDLYTEFAELQPVLGSSCSRYVYPDDRGHE